MPHGAPPSTKTLNKLRTPELVRAIFGADAMPLQGTTKDENGVIVIPSGTELPALPPRVLVAGAQPKGS